ncbi:hypothetical protein SAMN05444000_11723 [Shimia gijangensis]|uniref:AAA+ family ATPase n=1 Tax=Shimia gijangensis TaxID=1470563 RepID=A0A1M6P072_9RHOB|nr:hypothetical protein [Shimia gijangensis]SHK01321.1 hypothetical protein SAMN05444000_11723 [Shimia gijangensis]
MKPVSIAPRFVLCLALIASPVVAEDSEDGLSLMEEGAMLFLRGLQKQVEPTLEDLGALAEEVGPALKSFADEMGPALGALLDEVEDWSAYHPPEILDNGDIIIRRKPPEAAPDAAPEDDKEQIDL